MPELVLYMKPGCHLCHNADALLRELQAHFAFSFRQVDITQDPVLYDRFREDIPVIELAGRVLLSAPIGTATAHKVLAQHLSPLP
jgi:hypothetical protein